jgi:hypothetical protein
MCLHLRRATGLLGNDVITFPRLTPWQCEARKAMYLLRRVRVTTVAVETQRFILCAVKLRGTCHCQIYKWWVYHKYAFLANLCRRRSSCKVYVRCFIAFQIPYSVTSALENGWLSALLAGRLYPQDHPGTHFKRLSRTRATSARYYNKRTYEVPFILITS